jgi:hypothetical protein
VEAGLTVMQAFPSRPAGSPILNVMPGGLGMPGQARHDVIKYSQPYFLSMYLLLAFSTIS